MDYFKEKLVKIQLIPEDEALRPLFWEYRLRDIQEMTLIILIMFTLQFALSIFQLSTAFSWRALVQLIPLAVIFVILFTIWLLRKRIWRWLPYIYIFTLILELITHVLGTPMTIAVMSPEEQDQNREANLRSQFANIFRATSFLILFASPSLLFLITYSSIYTAAIVSIILLKGDMDDPVYKESLKLQPANLVFLFLIFYTLHGRELRRFIDHQEILNS